MSDDKEREVNDNRNENREKVDKEAIPHFFPTFRMKRTLYPIPIIITMLGAGILAYLSYIVAGIQIEGGYFSEAEFGFIAALLNGLIFTGIAVGSAFLIVIIVKKKGVNALKYIFGISLLLIGILETIFFGEIILFLFFNSIPEFPTIQLTYNISYYIMIALIVIFNIYMIYRYFTTVSIIIKNFIVIYIGLITGALMGIVMPPWTTIAILVGISLYDIYAVLHKHGPIKQMIDLITENEEEDDQIEERIKSGEVEYDTSSLELGIGDLVFYSMLTSTALVIKNLFFLENLIITLLSGVAIIIGAAITIHNLKKNKILPGLPISIFLGLATMLISWAIFAFIL
ncbi:MAG: hypothetical protein EU541_00635 [Promethearchaeota archaeon]|nr:MAG: hypothetical protein EU541_00635 [Candidatus Lokiarchaeota archaeon]